MTEDHRFTNPEAVWIIDNIQIGPPGSIKLDDLDLYELLVRVRGLLSVYVPMRQADAAIDDLTRAIDVLNKLKERL